MRLTQTVKNVSAKTVRCYSLTALAVLMIVGQGAASAGACIRADVDEPVRFPDGDVHQAGTLKLCLNQDYSPVASLHVGFIDNKPLGMLTSRRDRSEGSSDRPFMMFVRKPDGLLQLYGYAVQDAGRMNTYMLQSSPKKKNPLNTSVETTVIAATTILRVPAGAP